MRLLRIYVAGPMTGLPELNFPAFHACAATLRTQGHDVVNPAEINPDTTMAWHECMRRDIAERLGLAIFGDEVRFTSPTPAAPSHVRLTQTQVEAFAHRRATKYTHRSDPTYHSYAFVPHMLMDFVGDVENALRTIS